MNDLVMDRALYLLERGLEPSEAIAKAKSAIEAEASAADLDKAKQAIQRFRWDCMAATRPEDRKLLHPGEPHRRLQTADKSWRKRPEGLDYGCYRMKVAGDIPESGIESGLVRYFGERMATPNKAKSKRQRMRPTMKGKRPERSIVRAVIAQQDAARVARLAKLGNAADYD